jgi:hypothetical protein
MGQVVRLDELAGHAVSVLQQSRQQDVNRADLAQSLCKVKVSTQQHVSTGQT